jgi:hypothetical protein
MVIVQNYNGAKFQRHCFDGLLLKTQNDFEYLLDDGAFDNAISIVEPCTNQRSIR